MILIGSTDKTILWSVMDGGSTGRRSGNIAMITIGQCTWWENEAMASAAVQEKFAR